ncbi:alpha/beta fold hydrolase [Streptomyces sioyaensis]|uniref:alpha/beta fold hydrolase n=1 Tax=Streptomyces sioyaensis TaxID=67364 RepID=UPI003D74BF3D
MSQLPRLEHFVAGTEDGPWITFVPGIGNDAEFWRHHAEVLAADHRTLRFEPWGCARSGPAPENCTIEQVAAGIRQLWDEVGIERSSVVGLGFGGSAALCLALRHPDRVDRVVACCCRPRQPDDRRTFWRRRQAFAREYGMTAMAEVAVDRWLRPAFRKAHPEVAKALKAAMGRMTVEGYCAYVGAFLAMDLEDELRKLAVPTLLVAAEHDHGGGPVDSMKAMAGALDCAHLAVIAGSGHLCNHESPDAMADLLRSFL